MDDYHTHIPITGEYASINDHVTLYKEGLLIIKKGFRYDGPSGPTIDTKSSMVGSMIHDALYMLMRRNKLDRKYRKIADEILRDTCIHNGMWEIRAWMWYFTVRLFSAKFAESDVIDIKEK